MGVMAPRARSMSSVSTRMIEGAPALAFADFGLAGQDAGGGARSSAAADREETAHAVSSSQAQLARLHLAAVAGGGISPQPAARGLNDGRG